MKELDRRKFLWIELGVVYLWLIIPYLLNGFFAGGRASIPDDHIFRRITETATPLGDVAALAFILWISGDSLKSFGFAKEKFWRFLVTTGIILAIEILVEVITFRGNALPTFLISFPAGPRLLPWVTFTTYLIVGTTFEEFLFRGYLITRLEELLGRTEWAILVSTFTFGLAHSSRGWIGIVGSLAFGITYAVIFARTRSLVSIIVSRVIVLLAIAMTMQSLLHPG